MSSLAKHRDMHAHAEQSTLRAKPDEKFDPIKVTQSEEMEAGL